MTAPLTLAHVLVVHDNSELREFFSAIIGQSLSGTVVSAASAHGAFRHLTDHRLDLCVLQLSQLTGRGAADLQQLRAHHPAVIVILVSAQAGEDRARGLGADFFLQLPVPVEELRTCLRSAFMLCSSRRGEGS